jgi:hypothetical protein
MISQKRCLRRAGTLRHVDIANTCVTSVSIGDPSLFAARNDNSFAELRAKIFQTGKILEM